MDEEKFPEDNIKFEESNIDEFLQASQKRKVSQLKELDIKSKRDAFTTCINKNVLGGYGLWTAFVYTGYRTFRMPIFRNTV